MEYELFKSSKQSIGKNIMDITTIILISILCSIPLFVLFFIIKSLYSSVMTHHRTSEHLSVKELGESFLIYVFLISVLIFMGVYIGLIPLSFFGLDVPQGQIRLDENGNPDCTPYASPWGTVCE